MKLDKVKQNQRRFNMKKYGKLNLIKTKRENQNIMAKTHKIVSHLAEKKKRSPSNQTHRHSFLIQKTKTKIKFFLKKRDKKQFF